MMDSSIEPKAVARAVLAANTARWADLGVTETDITVVSTTETEWHRVFFVTAAAAATTTSGSTLSCSKMVVNFPSWTGAALANKSAASRHVDGLGLGPAVLGVYCCC